MPWIVCIIFRVDVTGRMSFGVEGTCQRVVGSFGRSKFRGTLAWKGIVQRRMAWSFQATFCCPFLVRTDRLRRSSGAEASIRVGTRLQSITAAWLRFDCIVHLLSSVVVLCHLHPQAIAIARGCRTRREIRATSLNERIGSSYRYFIPTGKSLCHIWTFSHRSRSSCVQAALVVILYGITVTECAGARGLPLGSPLSFARSLIVEKVRGRHLGGTS
jgi:hypothetical protein